VVSYFRSVRRDVERLMRDATLTALAFAIALGWSLYQVASGVGIFVTTLLQRFETSSGMEAIPYFSGGLAWRKGNRVFAFGPVLQGFIEFAVVLAVFILVQRMKRSNTRSD
jgi:large-conductance mechanosensitive channel